MRRHAVSCGVMRGLAPKAAAGVTAITSLRPPASQNGGMSLLPALPLLPRRPIGRSSFARSAPAPTRAIVPDVPAALGIDPAPARAFVPMDRRHSEFLQRLREAGL